MSLVDIEQCDIQKDNIQVENVTISLLEKTDLRDIQIFQCKIIIFRNIQSCNRWFDYVKPPENAEIDFMLDISPDYCINIHLTKIFYFD